MDLLLNAWYFSSHVIDGVAGVMLLLAVVVVVVVVVDDGFCGTGVSCIGAGDLSVGVVGGSAGEFSLSIMVIEGGGGVERTFGKIVEMSEVWAAMGMGEV